MTDKYEKIQYHLDKAVYYLDKANNEKNISNKLKNLIISQFHENLISVQLKNPLFINLTLEQILSLSRLIVAAQIKSIFDNNDLEYLDELRDITIKYKFSWKLLLDAYTYDINIKE